MGTVVKIGKNIKNFKVGDEVYLSWVPSISSKKTNYLEYSEVFWKKNPIKSVIFTWSEYSLVHKQFVHKKNKKFLQNRLNYAYLCQMHLIRNKMKG